MIEIARALVQMRLDAAELRGVTASGGDVSWRLDTDFDANEAPLPRSVISVRIGPSDTGAGIPFTADEVIETSDPGTDTALTLASRIARLMRGRAWYGPECAVHALSLQGMDSDSAAGAKTSVTLRWAGRASVRAR